LVPELFLLHLHLNFIHGNPCLTFNPQIFIFSIFFRSQDHFNNAECIPNRNSFDSKALWQVFSMALDLGVNLKVGATDETFHLSPSLDRVTLDWCSWLIASLFKMDCFVYSNLFLRGSYTFSANKPPPPQHFEKQNGRYISAGSAVRHLPQSS